MVSIRPPWCACLRRQAVADTPDTPTQRGIDPTTSTTLMRKVGVDSTVTMWLKMLAMSTGGIRATFTVLRDR